MTNLTFEQENWYPTVTEILKPYSGLDKVDPEILRKAGERGTKLHKVAFEMVNDLAITEEDENLLGYIDSMKKYWGEGYQVICAEQRIACDTLNISGQPDLIVIKDGLLTLIDWKSSYAESRTWCPQGAAYTYLAKTQNHIIQKIEFVKLDKNGKHPEIFNYNYNIGFSVFMKCYELHKYFFYTGDYDSSI